jgi:hypothetical protein
MMDITIGSDNTYTITHLPKQIRFTFNKPVPYFNAWNAGITKDTGAGKRSSFFEEKDNSVRFLFWGKHNS